MEIVLPGFRFDSARPGYKGAMNDSTVESMSESSRWDSVDADQKSTRVTRRDEVAEAPVTGKQPCKFPPWYSLARRPRGAGFAKLLVFASGGSYEP